MTNNNLMMSLEQDIQKIQDLTQQSSSAKSEAGKRLEQLQEKIKQGATTGDRIRDFVIANLGTFDSEFEKPYRDMEERLKGQKRNQILVVDQDESLRGGPGSGIPYISPDHIGIDITLMLGILTNGLELDIQKGDLVFPIKEYAEKRDHRGRRGKWELKKGPIKVSSDVFMNLGKKLERTLVPKPNDSSIQWERGLLIHTGNDVGDYFRGEDYHMFKRIGTIDNSRIDISYVEALNLLGQEAPPDFKGEYDKHVRERRVGIINKLEELVESQAKLNRKIKAVHGSMDRDDAIAVTMGPTSKLGEVEGEIRDYLKQAIELGMHIGNLELESRPGIIIKIPEYISGMCKTYKVALPK